MTTSPRAQIVGMRVEIQLYTLRENEEVREGLATRSCLDAYKLW